MEDGARGGAGLGWAHRPALDKVKGMDAAGYAVYVMDGCVRDRFLARSVND